MKIGNYLSLFSMKFVSPSSFHSCLSSFILSYKKKWQIVYISFNLQPLKRMKLCNLKASFIFKQPVKTNKKVLNFIIRHAPFTFTIYHHAPCLVNVTGVKSLNQLTLSQETIERKLQQQVDKIRIDNTFYSQKNFANVDLKQVYAFMKKTTHLLWNTI